MAKCGECGYLALLRGDGEKVEADGRFRREGTRDLPPSRAFPLRVVDSSAPRPPDSSQFDAYPRCASRPEVDFQERMEAYKGKEVLGLPGDVSVPRSGEWRNVLAVVLDEDWFCEKWYVWHPMHTPKEHVVMQHAEFLRAREDGRDADMRTREDRRDQDSRWRYRGELVVFGFVIAVATIVGSMIQAGWIPRAW